MEKDIAKKLFSEEEILVRVKEVAAQIDEDYKGKHPTLIAILKGSILFYSDLIRNMKTDVVLDFMEISSYGNGTTSGNIKFIKDADFSVEGKDILLVEDIVDSGKTIDYLIKALALRKPNSIKVCTLLDKKEARKVPVEINYSCFDVGNEFVVGYGLDYAEKYRNLPFIGVLKEEIYKK